MHFSILSLRAHILRHRIYGPPRSSALLFRVTHVQLLSIGRTLTANEEARNRQTKRQTIAKETRPTKRDPCGIVFSSWNFL